MKTANGLDAAGTALAAIIIGSSAGGALLSLVLWAAHGMARGVDTAFANVAIGAAAGGVVLAALVSLTLARRLGVWRSAALAMVAVAGAALVGVLTTAADMALGAAGLLILAALCIAAIVGAWRLLYKSEPA